MNRVIWQRRRSPRNGRHGRAPTDAADLASLSLDLRRAELYRILDALARAGTDEHGPLVKEFERVWEEFKVATARS